MRRWTWVTAGTMAAAAALFMLWSAPVRSGPLSEDGPVLAAAKPASPPAVQPQGRSGWRGRRQQMEADVLELHRHLQQLMKDRRQYRSDLKAGAPAARLQVHREAIARDLKLVKQTRLRIQAGSRADRYGKGQAVRRALPSNL